MSTDLYKQVLYNDGEGVTHTDLNTMQRNAESKVWEQLIHNSIGAISINGAINAQQRDLQYSGQDGTDHPTSRCYCTNPGAAYLRKTANPMEVGIAPGTLLQKLAVLTGDDPQIISFTFTGTEFWTVAAADATNPRVDLLQMALSWVEGDSDTRDFEDATTRLVTSTTPNKTRRVQCVLSVKQGVAAASPVIPEPDTGNVAVGMYCIGATAAGVNPIFGIDTAGAVVVVYDQRMPICVRAYTVDPQTFHSAAGWAIDATYLDSWQPNNATNILYVPCPSRGPGRLVGVGITHEDIFQPLTGVTVGGNSGFAGNGTYSARNTITPVLTVASALPINEELSYYVWESTPCNIVGPVIQQSVTTKIGVPLWANGLRCPYEQNYRGTTSALLATFRRLMLQVHNTAYVAGQGNLFGPVTFFIAEGL